MNPENSESIERPIADENVVNVEASANTQLPYDEKAYERAIAQFHLSEIGKDAINKLAEELFLYAQVKEFARKEMKDNKIYEDVHREKGGSGALKFEYERRFKSRVDLAFEALKPFDKHRDAAYIKLYQDTREALNQESTSPDAGISYIKRLALLLCIKAD